MEQLEERVLFSIDGLADLISPIWFADLSAAGTPLHAGSASLSSDSLKDGQVSIAVEPTSYDWIVRFNTAALGGITSVAQTTTLLAGSGIEFQALRGLGLVGQVLVRSYGASAETVENWLASDVNVQQFEMDVLQQVKATPNDPSWSQLWGLENTGQTGGRVDADIDASAAWNISTGSRSVVVAVIDTGVDYTHPDLAANIWTNSGEIAGNGIDDDGNGFVDDVHGYNFVGNNGNPIDDNGHGTHVSGTIGAVGNNATGVTGINWNTSIMALKFLDANGSGYTSDAVRALNYATMMRSRGANVRVANNSWGGTSYSSSMADAIQASGNAGILFVAAAGNDAQNTDIYPHYPSNYSASNVISVAATDSNDALASFSNYGAATVDLAAPGVGIYSTLPGNRYGSLSGTSMATPHVTGVAALAWAVAPNATVAEVRNAILQGVDPIASLQGKVATGGRLNAYNTVRLLNTGVGLPYIDTLTTSPTTVSVGGTATLVAQGVADSGGTVTSVSFYEDGNGNGQWDAGDRLLGTTTTIVGGAAQLALNTTGYAIGNHLLFARAVDNQGQWSYAVSAVLNVAAPDDHGNDPTTATRTSVGSTVSGVISYGGDSDWFAFDAIAGRSYVFRTELNTLPDSVLYLYNRDGATLLASNDDYGGSLASQIAWSASVTGTYYLDVEAYGHTQTGSYRLVLAAVNTSPVLAQIGNQTMSWRQDTLSIGLNATDVDGDPLQYSASFVPVDPYAQQAYDFGQRLGLRYLGWNNLHGAQEKWMQGANGDYYGILPNGEIRRWAGTMTSSPVVANFGGSYYQNPAMLYGAQNPAGLLDGSSGTVSFQGSTLILDPRVGATGTFTIQVSVSDGAATASQTFQVSVTNSAPVLAQIGNQTMSWRQDTLNIGLNATDADGDPLQYSASFVPVDPYAQQAYDFGQRLGLRYLGWNNLHGAQEKWMQGANGDYYGLLPNGEIRRWGGSSMATSPVVANFGGSYYQNPAMLYGAQNPAGLLDGSSGTVSFQGSTLILDPRAGATGTFTIQVSVSDGAATASQTFQVSVTNSAPVLAQIGNQTMSWRQDTLNIGLNATDADGDPLQYSASFVPVDPYAQQAYDFGQRLGLRYLGWNNLHGAQEKWMQGANGDYYGILPNGEIRRWAGTMTSSPVVANFGGSYYQNPAMLYGAQNPAGLLDGSSGTVSFQGSTLILDPRAGATGTFTIQVSVSDGAATASQTFQVSVTNSAPVLAQIGNQTMSWRQDTLNIGLNATDADGDPLQYSASFVPVDPYAQQAYDFGQRLGLRYLGWNNLHGAQEKWMQGANGDYYGLLPNGEIRRWGGSSMATSPVVANFGGSYYQNPAMLYGAQNPAGLLDGSSGTVSFQGSTLILDPRVGATGTFTIQVSVSDGAATASQTFQVSVTNSAPVLAQIGNQTMPSQQDTLSINLSATDADGDPLQYSASLIPVDPYAQQAYDLDQRLGLRYLGWNNLHGAQEKWMQAANGDFLGILPNGEVRRWGGSSMATSPVVANFSSSYYQDPSLLSSAQNPAFLLDGNSGTLSLQGSTLTLDPRAGMAGTFTVRVNVTDGAATTSQSFQVSVTNTAALSASSIQVDSPVVLAAQPTARLESRADLSRAIDLLMNRAVPQSASPANDARLEQRLDIVASLLRQWEAEEQAGSRSSSGGNLTGLEHTSRWFWDQSISGIATHGSKSRDRAAPESEILCELYAQLAELELSRLDFAMAASE